MHRTSVFRHKLDKRDKLFLKSDFDFVRQNGVKSVSPGILVVTAPGERLRCGVVCGKKYSLLSVVRNRARRLLWESFRLLKPEISPCTMILIPRKKMLSYKGQQVTAELAEILKEQKLMPQDAAVWQQDR